MVHGYFTQCQVVSRCVSITELTRKDIQSAVDAKASTGSKVYANRFRAALVAFTRWAWLRGYILIDVGAGIPRAIKEVVRDRVLSVSEVRRFGRLHFQWVNSGGHLFAC